jgi:hypothetical protein
MAVVGRSRLVRNRVFHPRRLPLQGEYMEEYSTGKQLELSAGAVGAVGAAGAAGGGGGYPAPSPPRLMSAPCPHQLNPEAAVLVLEGVGQASPGLVAAATRVEPPVVFLSLVVVPHWSAGARSALVVVLHWSADAR